MRILATIQTVEDLFDKSEMDYHFRLEDGKEGNCKVFCWKCKTCGWTGLPFLNNLPLPHECGLQLEGATPYVATTPVTRTFGG